jgi:hypothetical protein
MKDQISGQLLALEQQMAEIRQRLAELHATRNEAIEEVAVAIERMGCFGPDTINSFVIYIRGMKQ